MKKLIMLFTAAILSLCAFAQTQVLPNDPAVKVGKLDNGLTYYIRHNELPAGRAEFYLATNVGAIQETPDQDGLAHFLEHMCFNGTKNFPGKAILDYLQSIGASFGGNVNASTGVEETQYMLNNIPLVNQSVIDTCILIMHDYSHFVTNDPVEIDKERGVIVEERRSRRNAAWRFHEQCLPYYYGDSKYGTCTLIGSQENLLNFKPESLDNFYKTWYRPDLQAIIVVGDVDVDYVEGKIKEIFSDIPAAVDPKPKDVIRIPVNAEPSVAILTDPECTSSSLQVLWKSDATPEELNNTLSGEMTNLLKSIVSNILSERLSDIAAKPDAPYLAADSGIANLCETCEVLIGEIHFKDGGAIPAFTTFMTEMEKAKRYGFSEDEISRAKDEILSQFESAAKNAATRKNAQFIPELINNFFDNYAFMDPEQEYALVQQLLPMISPEIINSVFAAQVTDENLVVIYEGPENAPKPTKEEMLDVISGVKAAEIEANATEAIESDFLDPSKLKGSAVKKTSTGIYGSTVWTLRNGLKVVLYPTEYEKDRISFNLFKQGGSSLIDTKDLPSFDDNVFGLYLQNTGVSRFPATTVSKMLSGKNVNVSPYIESLRHGIEGISTRKDIETAFQLAYLAFADPRFDADEYAQGMNTINAVLPNLVSQPNYQLQKVLYDEFYGHDPRMRMIDAELVSEANLQTLERVYRSLFNDVAGAELVIVGDFMPSEIQPLVEKYFGSLPKGKKATAWKDDVPQIVNQNMTKDFAVDMQTPMSTVLDVFKQPMEFSYANLVAADAVRYILDMRYVTSLREEEGGTYGASLSADMSFAPKQYAALQIVYNSKPASTDRLRELAIRDFKDLAEQGPTEEEFSMAKKNLEKNVPENRIKNSYWMSSIISYESFGNNRDADYEAALNALTSDQVKAMASALFNGYHLELVMRPGATAEAE